LLLKKLAELRRDTEALVAALGGGGRCMEFPGDTSVSDLLEWFKAEVTAMPTAFAECNENITCYTLIDIFMMLVGEGCEHLPELKKFALSYDASLLEDFPEDISRIAKRLVTNWWTKHGLPYCIMKTEEKNWVSFITLYFDRFSYVV
jgi:hypothetical protein